MHSNKSVMSWHDADPAHRRRIVITSQIKTSGQVTSIKVNIRLPSPSASVRMAATSGAS